LGKGQRFHLEASNLPYGAIGIFVYGGAEVANGSDIGNYLALPNIGHFSSRLPILPHAITQH